MTSALPLCIRDLTCRYGDRTALDQVSLTLETGEILGVTGAAGAGMTTLIKAILLLVAPQSGRVLIYGKPQELASSRARIAYLPEALRPPGHLTGHDFISMANTVQRRKVDVGEVEALAVDLDLAPSLLAHPIRRYAKDDVQKLGLVAMFSTHRPILLLDRPMADLDPAARAGLRYRLKRHAESGGAVLIASSLVEDHQDVVGRMVLMKDGRLDEAESLDSLQIGDPVGQKHRSSGDSAAVARAAG
jgi:ABC-2 type transport system ATP-binding protein